MRTEPDIQAGQSQTHRPVIAVRARTRVRSGILQRVSSPDLLLLIAAAILLPLMLLIPFPLIRIPLGIILVLFAPGYALIAALFANREELSGSLVVGLSFGASIAVMPMIALALDLSSAGITPLPIMLGLSAWIGLWTGIAFRRRLGTQSIDQDSLPAFHLPLWKGFQWSRPRSIAAITVLGGIASAAVLGTVLISAIATEMPSTEFYVLGSEGEARDYPRVVESGEPVSVTLGIANKDDEARAFHVSVNALELHNTDRRARVASVGPFYIEPGQTYERTISWRMPVAGRDKAVSFDLYREGDTQPYRSVTLFLDVTASEPTPLN